MHQILSLIESRRMESGKTFLNQFAPCGCFTVFKEQEAVFVKEFKYWFLILDISQSFLGRCLLILKNHKTDEVELTNEEALEKHKAYKIWREAVRKAFNPDKINQAQLGNEEHVHKGHLHWHFIPRYRRPISFTGQEFQYDTTETQKVIFTTIDKRAIYSLDILVKIKGELQKYLK